MKRKEEAMSIRTFLISFIEGFVNSAVRAFATIR
jgi:hypothetical protein